jgi:hypothetical protein
VHKLCNSLKLNNATISSNSSCKFIDHTIEDNDILSYLSNSDAVIALYTALPAAKNCEKLIMEPYFKLLLFKNYSKLVFIDYFERSWDNQTKGNPQLLREEPFIHEWFVNNADVYFKRELYPDLKNLGLLPYPEPTFRQPQEKSHNYLYDVFCSFPQQFTGLRKEAIRVCEKLQSEGFNILIKHDCSPQEYIYNVNHSYITIDAYGAGQINHRFLELIALRTVVCRQKYTIEYYKDYDSSMVLEYDSADELERVLRVFIGKKELLCMMEENAYRHYLQYHTKMKVGEYLLSHI